MAGLRLLLAHTKLQDMLFKYNLIFGPSNISWVIDADSSDLKALRWFAAVYEDELDDFSYPPFVAECEKEGTELFQARKLAESCESEYSSAQTDATLAKQKLSSTQAELASTERKLSELTAKKTDNEERLQSDIDRIKEQYKRQNEKLQKAYDEEHEGSSKSDITKDSIGCGKGILLFFIGILCSSIGYGIFGAVFDAIGIGSRSSIGTILLLVLQIAVICLPFVLVSRKNKQDYKQRLKSYDNELSDLKKTKKHNYSDRDREIAEAKEKMEQENIGIDGSIEELQQKKTKLEPELAQYEADLNNVEERLEKAESECRDANKKLKALEFKWEHEILRENIDYILKRDAAYEQWLPSLSSAFEEKQDELRNESTEERDARNRRIFKIEEKLDEARLDPEDCLAEGSLLSKTYTISTDMLAEAGERYPLFTKKDLLPEAIEAIEEGKADNWIEALDILDPDWRADEKAKHEEMKARMRKNTSSSTSRSTPRGSSSPQSTASRSASSPSTSSKTRPSQSSGSRSASARPSSHSSSPTRPRPASGAARPGSSSRPGGKPRPSGSPRPSSGSRPSGTPRRKGTPGK